MATRNDIVKKMQSWVGLKKSDGSHKQIIDIYNTYLPHPRGYKLSYNDAWCAGTVSAAAIACGCTDIIPVECSCNKQIALFKAIGEWQENDAYVPQPGDVIYYDWDDSGKGDNTGRADHVGIVEKVSGNTITVIEGNKNNAVSRRTITVGGRYIRGYGLPKYRDADPVVQHDSSKEPSGTGKVELFKGKVTASSLNVRVWAGTEYKTCSFSPLKKGAVVSVCGGVKASDGVLWYYICYNKRYGFVHSAYIKK